VGQGFADDEGGFSVTPLVEPQQLPPGVRGATPIEASLSRRRHRAKDWNPGECAASRPARPERPPEPAPEPPSEPGVRDLGSGVGVVFGA
jgi:hypothetical protein